MSVATRRRLIDELNIETPLEYIYKFSYQADFGDSGSENELCHVYLGKVHDSIRPNQHEIDRVRFVSAGELATEFAATPEQFTPWFKMEWQTLTGTYSNSLAAYLSDQLT